MRLSFRLVMAWLVALSFACTDHGTGPATSTDATLALRPSFSTAGAAQEARAIHRIRLEVRAEGTTEVLLRTVVDVDPTATSWSVPLDVPFVPGRRIVVTIELIHVAADGSESVEWSGVTAPIALASGATTENAVEVFPGPLDNLQIRSLTLQDAPAEMLEGDAALLRTVVDAPAGAAVRVFWSSTNPAVMSVDNTGRVVALLPGTTQIIAVAGPFADTAVINVLAKAHAVEVTPSSVLLEHIGADALLTGRVLDARGDAVPGTTVEWSVSDAAVLQDLGGGSVRALAPGTATVTATSPQAPGLSGAATVNVVQRPAAIRVSPDVVVLNALGATAPLSAVVNDAGGTAIAGIAIDWSSTDLDIATVSADGVVTAVGDGTTRITAAAAGLSASVLVTVARTPARLTIIAGDGQTAPVGAAVAVAPAVRVEDATGHAMPGITVGFSVVAGGGTVAVASAVSDAAGTASAGGWTLGTTAGENRMTATASGVSALTFTATAVAGAPAAIAAVAGDGQTAPAGSAVTVAPAVRVTDQHGNPVAGVTIAFTTGASGGTITPATVATGADGIASATSWQLGTVAGTYTAHAAADGVGSVTFTATAQAGAATVLVMIAGDGQAAAAGTALPIAPSVRVVDAHGNGVAGVTVTFAASGGTITPATVVSGADGVASAASWQLGTVVGTYTVQASADGVASIVFTATAVAGAPGNIAIIAGNAQTAAVGTAVAVAPAVQVTDVHGNAVPGVTVAFAVGTGGGTVAPASVVTDAAGTAAVTSWTLGAEPGENTLIATVGELTITFTASGVASTDPCEPVPITIGTVATGQLSLTGCTVDGLPVQHFSLVLAAQTALTSTITTSVAYQPTLSFGDVVITDEPFAAGTFTGGLVLPAGSYLLTIASLSTESAAVTIDMQAGEPTSCMEVFTVLGLTIGGNLTTTDCVSDGESPQFFDYYSVFLAAGTTVQWHLASGIPLLLFVSSEHGGPLGVATEPATDVVRTYTVAEDGWYLTHVVGAEPLATGPYTLSIEEIEGPDLLSHSLAEQSAGIGQAVEVPPRVTVFDRFESPIKGVPVTFTVQSGGGIVTGGAPLSATSTVVYTNAAGDAALDSWVLGPVAGVNTVVATVNGLEATPFTFTATAVDPCADAPALAVGGAQLTGEFSATGCVVDGVPTNFFTITLDAPTVFTVEVPTAVNGGIKLDLYEGTSFLRGMGTTVAPALFPIAAPAGTYRLRAQPLDGTTVGTYGIVNNAGSTGCGHVGVVRAVTVTGSLADGDCVTDSGVQDNYSPFVAPTPTTAMRVSVSASAAVTLLAVRTDGTIIASADGTAPVLTFVPPTDFSHVAVRAPATGATYSIGFEAVLPPTAIAIHDGDAQTADAGSAVPVAPAVIVHNANAEPVQGVVVTFTVASGGGSVTGATAVTGADGIARVGSWTLAEGANTLTAQAAGVTSTVTFTATGAAAAPLMTIDLVDRTFVGVSFSAMLRVTVNQPAPAGGLVVSVFSDDVSRLTVAAPGTITIAEGATSGTITVNGVAAGTAPVRAVATGFPDASAGIVVSLRLISLPTTLNVPFGHNASLPVQLAEPAPAGGTVVTLTSSDPSLVEVLTPTVTVLEGATTANAVVYGALPGPATLSATATEYIAGSSAATTRAELLVRTMTGNTTLVINEAFGGQIRLRLRSAGSDIAAPSPGVTVNLTAADPTCVAVPATVTIPTGLTQVTIDVSYGGSATTMCSTQVTATGTNLVADNMTVRVDPTPNITLNPTTIGSGLQRFWSGNLGASNHGGATVRIESTDPTKLLIAPDGSTVGSAFLDVFVADGSISFGFWLQALEGQVGDVNVTATATGFNTRTAAMSVVQPALQMTNLGTSTTTLSGDAEFRVQVGLPCCTNGAISPAQQVRAGAQPLVATITTSAPAVGELVTNSATAASVTVEIPAGSTLSPSTVAAGGVALRPTGAGETIVAATIPGFNATTNATRTVAIAAPNINLNATQIGSGLQRFWSGSLGASNHGGVTVRIESTDPTKLLIAPDGSTVGSAFLDVVLADGSIGFNFWLQALEGQVGDVNVTATATGFNTRTTAMSLLQPSLQLTGLNTSTTTLSGDDPFRVQVGLACCTNGAISPAQQVRAGAQPLVATITTSAPAVGQLVTSSATASSVTVEIPAGSTLSPSSVAAGGVDLRPTGAGETIIAATIPGFNATTNATRTIAIAEPNINLNATQIGSGLQRFWSGSLGASNHGGVTVRIESTDPTKLLIAPDGNTVGSAFLDVVLADGSTGFNFWMQALEGEVGDVNVTATATGFNTRTTAMSLVQPALQLTNLSTSTTTLSGDAAFRVQIGLPCCTNGAISPALQVRAGAPALVITITSSSTAGQLITESATGGTVTVQIPAGSTTSPSTVAAGGVALRPLTAGVTDVRASAAGFMTTTNGERTVTISAPAISINNTTVGAGLQRQWSGSLGATNHDGVTVRVSSSNDAFVIVAPDGGTVGTGALDIVVPAGQSSFGFWIQGLDGVTGTISLTATASGFTDGSGTVDIVQPAFQLTGLATSLNTASNDDVFRVHVGLACCSNGGISPGLPVRAGSSITVSLTSSDETVGPLVTSSTTARTVDITIPAGQAASATSVSTGGVAFRPTSAGSTTISSTIAGFIATNAASQTVTVAPASINVNGTTVGAGLQAFASGALSGPDHGGVTVRLTSSDPTRLLLAPDASTAGATFIDVNVANGTTGFSYYVQGLEGMTGTVTVTASTAGFTDGVASHSVMQPAVEIIDLATSMLATAADDPFRVRVGIPNAGHTGFSQFQNVRAGAALTATLTSDAAAVGRLVTQAVTGTSVSVNIAGGANASPGTVATGGVAFDPQMAGTANVAVTIPGFVLLPTATRTVTVSN